MAIFKFYIVGCIAALIVNTVHSIVFFKDVGERYPNWQKANVFVWSSFILGSLSWFGFFLVSVSLGCRIKEEIRESVKP